jgi:NADH-quinone oxidoreductase subunit H
MVDFGITFVKTLLVLLMVLNISALFSAWVDRKASALMQDRIGANRASIFGVLPFNLGLVNSMVCDPIKLFTKEDFIPPSADKLLHTLAPIIAFVPALVTFIAIPFGDVLIIGDREINLQAANLNVGILYILAMVSLGVYGVVLAGWASNNRWALLGGIRASAQMISYEIAMGLSLIGVVLTFGSLDLQEIARAQGHLIAGWIPAWGILYQPVAFFIFMAAGIAESKRIPFDLPEAESELIQGYFTEYSGSKQATFMVVDLVESVIVSGLVTTLFFGGWQIPFLMRDGFHFPWGGVVSLPSLVVALLQIGSFTIKVLFFTFLQLTIRWTLPRFRYDQLMNLGWKGLLPLSLLNVMVTALVIVLVQRAG